MRALRPIAAPLFVAPIRFFEGVGIVFSPSDHHGIWAMQREGISGKGILPEYALEVVERIAKEKALA